MADCISLNNLCSDYWSLAKRCPCAQSSGLATEFTAMQQAAGGGSQMPVYIDSFLGRTQSLMLKKKEGYEDDDVLDTEEDQGAPKEEKQH